MKKSLIGLGFGVLLMLLMLAAMVSAPAEEEAPPPVPAPVCAAQMTAPEPERGAAPERRRAAEGHEEALPAVRQTPPRCPRADANGVPLLRQTYRRANFRAFHFSDEAG